jgi:hypothetical protein
VRHLGYWSTYQKVSIPRMSEILSILGIGSLRKRHTEVSSFRMYSDMMSQSFHESDTAKQILPPIL